MYKKFKIILQFACDNNLFDLSIKKILVIVVSNDDKINSSIKH